MERPPQKPTPPDWPLRLALLKESRAYRAFWAEHGPRALEAWRGLPENEAGDELADFNGILWHEYGLRPPDTEAAWLALDPKEEAPEPLPLRFHEPPPVVEVCTDALPAEGQTRIPIERIPEALAPSDRILKIDLSRKRGELIEEFKRFLDRASYFRTAEDCPAPWKNNYDEWAPDNSRLRAEAWKALAVWRLRRKRKTYPEIAAALDLTVSAAKMAFRRAHELVEGAPYDPEARPDEIRLGELRKTCDSCPIRATCTEPCPDVLHFLEQDQVNQRELPIDTIR